MAAATCGHCPKAADCHQFEDGYESISGRISILGTANEEAPHSAALSFGAIQTFEGSTD
jgi:hypothetical protein